MSDHAKEKGELWPDGSNEILLRRGTKITIVGREGMEIYLGNPVYGMVKKSRDEIDEIRKDIREGKIG